MGIGSAIGGIASGVLGASSARSASRAQERAADQQIELERDIYDDTTGRFAPFYDGGLDFYNALRFELLGGDAPVIGGTAPRIVEDTRTIQGTAPKRPAKTGWRDIDIQNREKWLRQVANGTPSREVTEYRVGDQVFGTREAAQKYADANKSGGQTYRGFQATPGYQFALDQGIDAIDSSAAARGNVFSGATMKAAQEFGTGLANQEYGTYLNRLTGQAGQGQAAAGNIATAGANYTSGAGNALANMGNAQAAGYIGVGNAITGGINNAISAYGYMQPNSLAPKSSLRPQARPF